MTYLFEFFCKTFKFYKRKQLKAPPALLNAPLPRFAFQGTEERFCIPPPSFEYPIQNHILHNTMRMQHEVHAELAAQAAA